MAPARAVLRTMPTTWSPRSWSCRTTARPTKPAAPVTTTLRRRAGDAAASAGPADEPASATGAGSGSEAGSAAAAGRLAAAGFRVALACAGGAGFAAALGEGFSGFAAAAGSGFAAAGGSVGRLDPGFRGRGVDCFFDSLMAAG
jgi:hypothetical protein